MARPKPKPALDDARNEVYGIVYKATIEDKTLDKRQDKAKLVKDLRLGGNDMTWIAGRLTEMARTYGGGYIYPTEVEGCETMGALVRLYAKALHIEVPEE